MLSDAMTSVVESGEKLTLRTPPVCACPKHKREINMRMHEEVRAHSQPPDRKCMQTDSESEKRACGHAGIMLAR